MRIDDLIQSLKDIRTDHGNVTIHIQNIETKDQTQISYAAYNFDTGCAEICYEK